jgi:glycosyltransferase involved in cell wall biosynthesis
MNIGIILDNGLNADVRVRNEIGILSNAGHSVFVLCFGFDGQQYEPVEGASITRIYIRKKTKDALFFIQNRVPFYRNLWSRRISQFIRENPVEVLHVHDLYMSKPAFDGIKMSGRAIPFILDLHENYPAAVKAYKWTRGFVRHWLTNPEVWQNKEGEYLSYASKLVVLSDSFKADLLNRFVFLRKENIAVFPNVIDLKRFESYPADISLRKPNRLTLLYFGMVAERRGIYETLEMLKAVRKAGYDAGLLVIGPVDKADRKRFREQINQPGLKDIVTHIPWIDISQLPAYMRIADICLSPLARNAQHESGVANKIYQYMFGAKPIVASGNKPQKELIETFECGLVYSSQAEYAACILKLANDPELRDKLGQNGYRNLYEKYGNGQHAADLLRIYSSLPIG